jgi:hypothetical protein
MNYYNNINFNSSGIISENLYRGQHDRIDELNTRIYDRFVPDAELQPNFGHRPVSTKYALYPILDRRAPVTVPLQSYLDYYPEVIFKPGDANGPVSGYFNNVEVESDLRNQNTYLDKDLGKKYIPSINSDLYKVTVTSKNKVEQPFPRLFKIDHIDGSKHIEALPKNIGVDMFNNHTRVQLRTLS